MLKKTAWAIAATLLVAGLCLADQWNKKTVLTVNERVQLPGAILEPGTYVVKLVDSLSNRHIVQVTNERGDHVYTTILAIPNYRLKVTGKSAFAWWETPAGNPPALRAWFYPGDNFGQEFAYPKGLSIKIAQSAHVPVPTATGETAAELKAAPVTKVEPTGEETELTLEAFTPPAAPAVTPRPAPVAAAPEPAPTPAPEPASLPATASPYATFGIAGLLALGAGFALRFTARRKA